MVSKGRAERKGGEGKKREERGGGGEEKGEVARIEGEKGDEGRGRERKRE